MHLLTHWFIYTGALACGLYQSLKWFFSLAHATLGPVSFLTPDFLHGVLSLLDHTLSVSKLMFPFSLGTRLPASCWKNGSQFKVEIDGISCAQSIVGTTFSRSLDYISSSAYFPIFFLVINTYMFLIHISKCPLVIVLQCIGLQTLEGERQIPFMPFLEG